jgi:hypothetical protein
METPHDFIPPHGSLQCRAGQWGSNTAASPRTPLPWSNTWRLTDADRFSMMSATQRRFTPTAIGITRNSDRHQFGTSDRHRRNPQTSWPPLSARPAGLGSFRPAIGGGLNRR